MRSLGIRTLLAMGAMMASLATAPCVHAQSPAAAKAQRLNNHRHTDTAGQLNGSGASQAIPPGGMPNGRTDTNGATGSPAVAPMMPPGGMSDTDTAGRTGTAAGQYQQPQSGGGHNWGWIGIFGLLGLLGLSGRNRTMITEDRTAARPTVNTRL
jgi:hypothetical protein